MKMLIAHHTMTFSCAFGTQAKQVKNPKALKINCQLRSIPMLFSASISVHLQVFLYSLYSFFVIVCLTLSASLFSGSMIFLLVFISKRSCIVSLSLFWCVAGSIVKSKISDSSSLFSRQKLCNTIQASVAILVW